VVSLRIGAVVLSSPFTTLLTLSIKPPRRRVMDNPELWNLGEPSSVVGILEQLPECYLCSHATLSAARGWVPRRRGGKVSRRLLSLCRSPSQGPGVSWARASL